jgi:hypothetical protein
MGVVMNTTSPEAQVGINDLKLVVRIAEILGNIDNVQNGIFESGNTTDQVLLVIVYTHGPGIGIAGVINIDSGSIRDIKILQIVERVTTYER